MKSFINSVFNPVKRAISVAEELAKTVPGTQEAIEVAKTTAEIAQYAQCRFDETKVYCPSPTSRVMVGQKLLSGLADRDLLTAENIFNAGKLLLEDALGQTEVKENCTPLGGKSRWLPYQGLNGKTAFKVSTATFSSQPLPMEELLAENKAFYIRTLIGDDTVAADNRYCAYEVVDAQGLPATAKDARLLIPEKDQELLENKNYNITGLGAYFNSKHGLEDYLYAGYFSFPDKAQLDSTLKKDIVIGFESSKKFLIGGHESIALYQQNVLEVVDRIYTQGIAVLFSKNAIAELIAERNPQFFNIPDFPEERAKEEIKNSVARFVAKNPEYKKQLAKTPIEYYPIQKDEVKACINEATRRATYWGSENLIATTQRGLAEQLGVSIMDPEGFSEDKVNLERGDALFATTLVHELGHSGDGADVLATTLYVIPALSIYLKKISPYKAPYDALFRGINKVIYDRGVCNISRTSMGGELPSMIRDFAYAEKNKVEGYQVEAQMTSQRDTLFYLERVMTEVEGLPTEAVRMALEQADFSLLRNPLKTEEERKISKLFHEVIETQIAYLEGTSSISGLQSEGWAQLNQIAKHF